MADQAEWPVDPDGMVTLKPGESGISTAGGIVVLVIGLVWSAVVFLFVYETGERPPTWFMAPFVLVGVALIVYGIYAIVASLMTRAKVAPALVRVSRCPLRLGDGFNATVRQTFKSPARIESMELKLLGREYVEYTVGTNTRTEEHAFVEHEELVLTEMEIQAHSPVGGECQFFIPVDAMHSFEMENNKIEWKLELRTSIARWPDYTAEFPIQVLPLMAPEAADGS